MKSRVKRISATTAVVATLVSGLMAISAPAQASAPTSWNQVDSTGFHTDVAYGRGLFVAVGISQNSYPQVKTSPNGRDWTTRTVPGTNTTFQWQGIAYGDGVFVAVGYTNPSTWARNATVMRSTDGINWSLVTLPPAIVSSMAIIKSIAYGNKTFTAVGRFGGSMYSTDFGLTWTQSSIPGLVYNSITFGNGLFVALASGSNALNATRKIVTSPDGITWTQQTTPDSEWSDITFGNGLFVAVAGVGTERIMTSSDGITWTSRTAPSTNQWTGITYGRDLFVAVAWSSTSTSTIMTSPDGITWTARTALTGGWNSIAYGPDVFVVTRSSNALMYSGTPNPTVSAPNVSHVFGGSIAAVNGVKVEGSGSTIGTISCGAFEDSGFTAPITTETRPGFYFTRCTGPINSTSATPSNVKPISYSNGTYQVVRPTGTFTYPVLTKEYGDTVPFMASSALSGAYVNTNFAGLVAGDVIETATVGAWTFSGNAHLDTATVGSTYTYRLNFNLVNYKATSGVLGTLASTYNTTQSPISGGVISVTKAPLTVSPAATETITVGAIVPETFTATYSGWKAGQSQNSTLTGWRAPVCKAPSVPVDVNRLATAVGTYTITCSGGLSTNYAFTYVAGTFVVLPATPTTTTITATNETSTVGSPIASISYTMTNLASGDWIPAGIEFSCDAYDGSNLVTSATKAGTYVSKCTGPAYTGQGKNISYVSGTYLVNKAPLTLTALNRNKVYGDVAAAGTASNVAVTGLVNGDTVTVSFAYSGGGPLSAGSGGGTYTITPSATLSGGRTLSEFYDVTVNTGTFTVDKAPLRVRADDGWGVTGQPRNNYLVPTGGANAPKYYGFKNGETSIALSTPATCAWQGTSVDGSGNLLLSSDSTIVCSGAASNNYSFTYEVSTFPVRQQAIWVKAANGTSVYGSSLAGVNDYGINASSTPVNYFLELNTTRRSEISCTAFRTLTPTVETLTSSAAPGTYTVRCTGPNVTNLTPTTAINYELGVYTITKPTLTIKANDRTRIYGNSFADGALSDSTVSGLVGSDTVAVTYTYSAVQDSATAVGRYTITPVVTLSGGRTLSDFYQVILANGVSSVTPLKVQVAAQNLTNVKFGSTPPASYTYTLKKLDGTNVPTADVFTVAPTCTSGFSGTTPRGTELDIVCAGGTLVASNYEVEFIKGTLEVEPVPLTVGSGTSVKTNTTSGDPRIDFTAKATTGNWVAGCKVSWTLDPSAGTGSTYEAYPGTALLGTNNDLVLNAPVPYGVYNVTMSLSGNCSGASVQSVLVVAPNTVGTDSRTIGSGTYTDARTSNTVTFSFEWQKSGSTFTTPFTWTVADRWRINSTLGSQVTLVGMDGTSTTTSTWGRNDCPATLVGTCSTLIGQVMLQRWAPNWRLAAGGYWVDFGLVSMTMRVAETTSGADQVSMQLRQVPGSRAIPSRVPTSLWVALQSGTIQHLP